MTPLLLSLGIPARFHKAALIGAGVILLAIAAVVIVHRHDNAVRKADRAATEAAVAKKALDAERAANRADAARQTEIQANDALTRKAIDDAVAKDPAGAKSGVGPAVRAATDELRRRQARDKRATD